MKIPHETISFFIKVGLIFYLGLDNTSHAFLGMVFSALKTGIGVAVKVAMKAKTIAIKAIQRGAQNLAKLEKLKHLKQLEKINKVKKLVQAKKKTKETTNTSRKPESDKETSAKTDGANSEEAAQAQDQPQATSSEQKASSSTTTDVEVGKGSGSANGLKPKPPNGSKETAETEAAKPGASSGSSSDPNDKHKEVMNRENRSKTITIINDYCCGQTRQYQSRPPANYTIYDPHPTPPIPANLVNQYLGRQGPLRLAYAPI